MADTVGAGSEDFRKDGRLENGGWMEGAKGLRGGGQMDLVASLGARTVKPSQSSWTNQCEHKQTVVKVEDNKMSQVEDEAVHT